MRDLSDQLGERAKYATICAKIKEKSHFKKEKPKYWRSLWTAWHFALLKSCATSCIAFSNNIYWKKSFEEDRDNEAEVVTWCSEWEQWLIVLLRRVQETELTWGQRFIVFVGIMVALWTQKVRKHSGGLTVYQLAWTKCGGETCCTVKTGGWVLEKDQEVESRWTEVSTCD